MLLFILYFLRVILDFLNIFGKKTAGSGADGETRTHTAFATTPSRWRVYQFHHVGINKGNYTEFQGMCNTLLWYFLGWGLGRNGARRC